MYKVKITLPASITCFGLGNLGIAIGLHTTVEISTRSDDSLVVETEGEGAGRYGLGLRHPVALALMRIFQQQEVAKLGVHIKISNHIPIDSGLGAEAAFWVAGAIGANNLLGAVYTRSQILEQAALMSKLVSQSITSMMGGLTTSFENDAQILYRGLPCTAQSVVIVLPQLERYASDTARIKPDRIPLNDALFNLNRVPMLIDALQSGDYDLLADLLDDHLHVQYLKSHIKGYDEVVDVAKRAGAQAVTVSGNGPALVAFAGQDHKVIATAMEVAFQNYGIKTRTWIAPVDTQGVVISAVGSP
jgi:homoserine kinase